MAVKTFEEVISQLSADERKLFDSTLTKHPDLKEGWLRQDDYSRKLNEFKSKETEFQSATQRANELEAWADRNVPIYNALVEKGIVGEDGEELWTSQKTELEAQLEAAKKAAVAGGDMDPAELDKRVTEIVKANGGLSKAELEAVIKSQAKALAEETFTQQWSGKEKKFNEETIPFVAGFSAATAVVANRFERETGEKWTTERQKAMYELMGAEKNFDPFAVEEKLLAPFKEKKAMEAKIEEEVQKRVHSMRTMPGGGDEEFIPTGESAKGALRQALERSAGGETDFEALVKSQAAKAATELQAEGK
jgi:hypothetical protein